MQDVNLLYLVSGWGFIVKLSFSSYFYVSYYDIGVPRKFTATLPGGSPKFTCCIFVWIGKTLLIGCWALVRSWIWWWFHSTFDFPKQILVEVGGPQASYSLPRSISMDYSAHECSCAYIVWHYPQQCPSLSSTAHCITTHLFYLHHTWLLWKFNELTCTSSQICSQLWQPERVLPKGHFVEL